MDLPYQIIDMDNGPRQSFFDGEVEFVRAAGEKADFAHAWFTRGSILPSPTERTHTHEAEEILYIVSGRLRLWWENDGEESVVLGPGDVAVIPSQAPHGGEVLEDCEVIGMNTPPRRDHADAELVTDAE